MDYRGAQVIGVTAEAYAKLVEYIDAKLSQAKLRGMELADEKVFQPDMDEWKARATAAEAKLEAIRQGVEWLVNPSPSSGPLWFSGFVACQDEVLALLAPPTQPGGTDGLPG